MQDHFIRRFQAIYAPQIVLNSLMEVPLFKLKTAEKESSDKIKWFSLPFHPAVRGINLGSAISGFCADPALRGVFKAGWPMTDSPVIRIAWKSMLQQAQRVYSRLWHCNIEASS